MKLIKLLGADVYRDGGSYSADYLTDENLNYSIFLRCSKMPDEEGLHHKWVFEYLGSELPSINCKFSENFVPVLTGSTQEKDLLERLNKFIEKNNPSNSTKESEKFVSKLTELIQYIALREPCFAWELTHLKKSQ